jgi:hypothetical protein
MQVWSWAWGLISNALECFWYCQLSGSWQSFMECSSWNYTLNLTNEMKFQARKGIRLSRQQNLFITLSMDDRGLSGQGPVLNYRDVMVGLTCNLAQVPAHWGPYHPCPVAVESHWMHVHIIVPGFFFSVFWGQDSSLYLMICCWI